MDNLTALDEAALPDSLRPFADALRHGLSAAGQRTVPSQYLYDEVGSALFDVICVLPEYGLTRADARLIHRHAADWLAELPSPLLVAELGSGSSKKTRHILELLATQQHTDYFPIDISAAALAQCERELAELERLTIHALHTDYLSGLAQVEKARPAAGRLLVLFLGSTIGNFAPAEGEQFLRRVRALLRPGDALLLSTDLVKSEAVLTLAYNDTAGVTAAFNKNLLARINRELDGNFELAQLSHEARWNPADRRVEMHLRALTDMTVTVRRAGLTFDLLAGETIKTEDCYKFVAAELPELGRRTGFRCQQQWCDREWEFAQSLLICE